MKKSLVLAMAMALGVTASAYAANPFSDVPAGHWAYDSISKLAAAGIIDGYGDGTYRGGQLMTRYEMAQIVAKALAKGANVDRLASEFAKELDALGVRVAKLEKNSDNVKITGQIRYHYADDEVKVSGEKAKGYQNKLRSRIWFTGEVNDNWKYVGMLENVQDFSDRVRNETTNFQRAYVQGNLGGAKLTAGRFGKFTADGNVYDTRMDGIQVGFGKEAKFSAYYGIPTNQDSTYDFNKAWGLEASTEIGSFDLGAGYDRFTNSDGMWSGNLGIWNLNAVYDFGNATLGAMYLKSNLDSAIGASNSGFVVTGTLGGAKASKPGSWGLDAKYYNQGAGTFVAHTMNGMGQDYASIQDGFKGFSVGAGYTVAKNIVGRVEYYDLKGKEMSDIKAKTIWSQLVFTF